VKIPEPGSTITHRKFCPACKRHQTFTRLYGPVFRDERGSRCQHDAENCAGCGAIFEGMTDYDGLAAVFPVAR
jgi:hypothetical protein